MRLAGPILVLAISAATHGCRGSPPRIVSTETPVLELDAAIFPRWTIPPDGRKVAHVAVRGAKWFVGVQGTRVAFTGRRGERSIVVVDGVEREPHEGVEGVPAWSPDSKRVACARNRRGKSVLVVDGVESREYDGFLRGAKPVFDSADWSRRGWNVAD